MTDKRKPRRPTRYTPELAKRICTLLAGGESLRTICKREGMPTEAAVRQWAIDDVEGFAAHYTRARDLGLDAMADKAIEEAATPRPGKKTVRKPDGTEVTTGDAVERSRLLVDTIKWYLSKIAPKKYGDHMQHTFDATATLRLEFGLRRPINGECVRHSLESSDTTLPALPTNQPTIEAVQTAEER